MKYFNLNFLEKEVGTQYNDMCGLAAIDGHDSLIFNLNELCENKGFDLGDYNIVGMSLYDGETIGVYDVSVSVLLTKKGELPNSEGQQKVYKKDFRMPYNELGTYIKRLNIAVVQPGLENAIPNPVFEDLDD
jgi:hypothetical protein